jgi:transposase-like protein
MPAEGDWREQASHLWSDLVRKPKPARRRHRCPHCGATFNKAADYSAHIARRHAALKAETIHAG